jgi:hypothetical protein
MSLQEAQNSFSLLYRFSSNVPFLTLEYPLISAFRIRCIIKSQKRQIQMKIRIIADKIKEIASIQKRMMI